MESTVVVAAVGIFGAVLTHFLTKRQQREAEWREAKLGHYRALLSAISDVAVDNKDGEAHRRFASAINTIALVGPQSVVAALLAFHEGVRATNPSRTEQLHDELLTKLIVEIRRDLGMRPKDDPKTFVYRLAGAPPKGAVQRDAADGRR